MAGKARLGGLSRLLRQGLAVLFLAAVLPASALAFEGARETRDAQGQGDRFMGMEPIRDAELAELRGGMSVGGMSFDFAVEVRMNTDVLENGENVFSMTTTLSFDNAQRREVTEIRTPDAQRIVDETLTRVQDSMIPAASRRDERERESTRITLNGNPGDDGISRTGNAVTAAMERLETGSRVNVDDGRTRVMQELGANQLATVIQNMGNGRTINRTVEMDLMISNFTEQVRQFNLDRLGQQIGRDVMDLARTGR